jgi:hypothetical protein
MTVTVTVMGTDLGDGAPPCVLGWTQAKDSVSNTHRSPNTPTPPEDHHHHTKTQPLTGR